MQDWSVDRWLTIAGIVIALLLVFSPFRRYVDRFNNWYDEKDRERLKRRLAYTRQQLQDIVDGTSHLHFQRSISGGLLALVLGLTMVFLNFVLPPSRRDPQSTTVLTFIALAAAIWQFGSAFRRLNGIREEELRRRIQKLETLLREFNKK
jgi:hypothetical protein